jgi:hypothetical protein
MKIFCPVCGDSNITITYNGKIRDGAAGKYTGFDVEIYKCERCGLNWHTPFTEENFYQEDIYRNSMGENVTLIDFCQKHDAEILLKLSYTGTGIYRDKLFMDVGAGGGGFADFISGVAKKSLLVEPNQNFRNQLKQKGYEAFKDMSEAVDKYGNRVELLTSWDVIEHVAQPLAFLKQTYTLLGNAGMAFIGTPTEYPILRKLLGATFDSFVFSIQHPWVFSVRSLDILAKKAGFTKVSIKCYQRFGIGNLIAWLQTGAPKGDAAYGFISPALDAHYKAEMGYEETAEYLVAELRK